MLIRKSFVFRLNTSHEISQQFTKFSGCSRFVFNKALEIAINSASAFNYTKSANSLPSLKKENSWLSEPPSQILQQSLKDLEKAFKNYRSGSGYPKFKKKNKKDSFRIPQGFKLDQDNSRIFIPKIGYITYRNSRRISGIPKNVTISKNLNSWDISIQTEEEIQDKIHKNLDNEIGLDLGVNNLITTSEGSYINPIKSYITNESKISKLNQILAKKKIGNRRFHIINKLKKLYKRIGDIRKNYIHNITTKLTNSHGTIVVEDLNISRMLSKGSAELNKRILDSSFFEIKRQIRYKLFWAGGRIIEVNPAYTSQTCNVCGIIDKRSRITRDQFKCIACGNENCADINAAKNILKLGTDSAEAAGHAVKAEDKNLLIPSQKALFESEPPSQVLI